MTHEAHPILLVEDDLSLRDSLCQFLEDHGYRTIVASTAKQGLEAIRTRRPALCLLDLNLPDGSGLDLLRVVAKAGAQTKVIVMTAFDLHHLRPTDAGHVLAGWMTKPVNPQDLLGLVESAAGRPANLKGGA
jgi:DNA-binding response OmpR family regulator